MNGSISLSSTCSRGFRAIASAIGLVAFTLIHASSAIAQSPPSPSNRFIATFSVAAQAPAQYEIFQTILDFAPGAATREHSHGGPEFVTVIEGQLTRVKGSVETVFTAGQTFQEDVGTYFTVANRGNARAMAFATILLSPGQPVTINHGDRPIPGQQPRTIASSRTTVPTQPAELDLQQRIIDFSAGAYAGPHRHSGPLLITQLSGEVVSRAGDIEIRQQPGGTYVEAAGVEAEHRNVGRETATVAVTFLLPRGAPPAVPVVQTLPAAPGSIIPPRTGDGGIR